MPTRRSSRETMGGSSLSVRAGGSRLSVEVGVGSKSQVKRRSKELPGVSDEPDPADPKWTTEVSAPSLALATLPWCRYTAWERALVCIPCTAVRQRPVVHATPSTTANAHQLSRRLRPRLRHRLQRPASTPLAASPPLSLLYTPALTPTPGHTPTPPALRSSHRTRRPRMPYRTRRPSPTQSSRRRRRPSSRSTRTARAPSTGANSRTC